MFTPKTEPLHRHDSDDDRYLGTFEVDDFIYDAYLTASGDYLARFGTGGDYLCASPTYAFSTPMRVVAAIAKLARLADEVADPEISHSRADEILCSLLNHFDFVAVVDAWRAVRKWDT